MSTLRYFGEKWDAPALDGAEPCDTPAGAMCLFCDDAIEDGDQGVVYPDREVTAGALICTFGEDGVLRKLAGELVVAAHIECWVRQFIGGANHILGRCSCCGGSEDPDPPGLSRREAAKLAVRVFENRGQG